MTLVAVDTGGTFTDLVAAAPKKTIRLKVPSTPNAPEQAIVSGLRELLEKHQIEPTSIIHGTTVGTNTILEGSGAKTVLITNSGLTDLLYLRRQARPELYALHPTVPKPLVPHEDTVGIQGRLAAGGEVITPLPPLEDWIQANLHTLSHAKAFAVSLLHSYANPIHEQAIGLALKEAFPTIPITLSCELVPLPREYERTQTTCANAFIAPKVSKYLTRLQASHRAKELLIMGSAGGCITSQKASAEPILTALSGPAGGLIGAKAIGNRCKRHKLLSFDMGGTSADIAVIDGELLPTEEGTVGDIFLRTPLLPISTIGAGGGSIAYIDDGGALMVGPQSAGAFPGPACYGNQINSLVATVTDAHVVLNRINSLLGGSLHLDRSAARAAIEPLASKLKCSIEETAGAIIGIANATMARVSKQRAMKQGVDPRNLTLVAFGGAGGLHACEIADEMGCTEVIFPPESGLLSAEGMLEAPLQSHQSATLFLEEKQWTSRLASEVETISQKASLKTQSDFPAHTNSHFETKLYFNIRYEGQTASISIAEPIVSANSQPPEPQKLAAALRRNFEERHKELFSYHLDATHPLVLVSLRSVSTLARTLPRPAPQNVDTETTSRWTGPQSIASYGSTLWLPAGWGASMLPTGDILCKRKAPKTSPGRDSTEKDIALGLEIHRQRLASIAEEMGVVLRNAAFSANIKERQDYSCAVFNAQGEMLAQAAHIPVHLGSQPLSVEAARKALPIHFGDTIILNDPFAGGTHLPDLTIINPAYLEKTDHSPLFFVANRAHHADVGGITPGSIPAPIDAKGLPRQLSIHDEGIRIPPAVLDDALRLEFANKSRTPQERFGDLRSQEAANSFGSRRVIEFAKSFSPKTLQTLNNSLLDYAESRMRSIIQQLPDGKFSFCDKLEAGPNPNSPIPITVTITISGNEATVDFTDAPKAVPNSLNAVRAITVAAVFYVFQCLGEKSVPANSGMLRPIRILTTPGTICDAQYPSAVSAGNVETSQRLVDVLFGALAMACPDRIPAASGGSMTNVLFGGTRSDKSPFIHYETLACGSGASPLGPGADAIHTHMTNTLNTPIEQLEREFPVRITHYGLRPAPTPVEGEFPGGRGICREYQFLSKAEVTVIAERHQTHPYGLNGASSGSRGATWVKRTGRPQMKLPAKVTIQINPNETLRIETPGGGSYKSACQPNSPK